MKHSNNAFAIFKQLEIEPSHLNSKLQNIIHKVKVLAPEQLVPVENISRVCVMVEVDSSVYVTTIPNMYETD